MGAGVHRPDASVLHIDLDAFYAAVEQRDKPSLRGRPVIVGGTGGRGVVSTASYEARVFGVRSAMPMAEARARCPQAAVLAPRFDTYRTISEIVMEALRELSPLVEPLSLDEAFVDLSAGPHDDLSPAGVTGLATDLREAVRQRTDLTASVGAATTKTLAKIASEKAKPDGLLVVAPGSELDVLHPLPVRALWGIGPATGTRVRRRGVRHGGDVALPQAAAGSGGGTHRGRPGDAAGGRGARDPGRESRPLPGSACPWRRPAAGGGRTRLQVDQRRGHLRTGHRGRVRATCPRPRTRPKGRRETLRSQLGRASGRDRV